MKPLLIGSHVDMAAPDYLVAAVKASIAQGASTMMIYTGAPQNSIRKPIEAMKIEEGLTLLKEAGIDPKTVVVHAPYIINLGNTIKQDTFDIGLTFLTRELQRVSQMGFTMLVLHPGAHVGAGSLAALDQIVKGLDAVLKEDGTAVKIALETMAGKGTEVGITFEEIQYIIKHSSYPHRLGVCLDTCHIHDAGYDVSDVDGILNTFDRVIGLDKLLVVHINDSKNPKGANKDRHDNIGYGYIGFETLLNFVHHPRLAHLPKILETPYLGELAPYKEEIHMLKQRTFIPLNREMIEKE
jgi:deoxyribonuclease-4